MEAGNLHTKRTPSTPNASALHLRPSQQSAVVWQSNHQTFWHAVRSAKPAFAALEEIVPEATPRDPVRRKTSIATSGLGLIATFPFGWR
ncbi:hypothetical protein VTO42DRAFT_2363 [Malbranchea cinnamomea]